MTDVYDLPEWAAFIAAVKSAPDDDLPRKVAADWLQEHGEDERADLIRRQCCNQVVLPRLTMLTSFESVLNAQPHQCVRGAEAGTATVSSVAWGGLLLLTFRHGFVSRVSGPLAALVGGERCGRCGGEGKFRSGEWLTYWKDCPDCRGAGRTEGALRRLVRREPVAEVVATDCEPLDNAGVGTYFGEEPGPADTWIWIRQTGSTRVRWELPPRVFDLLEDDHFSSEANAHAALSTAVLQLASQPDQPA